MGNILSSCVCSCKVINWAFRWNIQELTTIRCLGKENHDEFAMSFIHIFQILCRFNEAISCYHPTRKMLHDLDVTKNIHDSSIPVNVIQSITRDLDVTCKWRDLVARAGADNQRFALRWEPVCRYFFFFECWLCLQQVNPVCGLCDICKKKAWFILLRLLKMQIANSFWRHHGQMNRKCMIGSKLLFKMNYLTVTREMWFMNIFWLSLIK